MKFTFVILTVMLGNIIYSQDTIPVTKPYLSIYFQQNYSKFIYKNSNNEKDTNLMRRGFTGAGIDYTTPINDKISLRAGVVYLPLGASSSLNDERISWDLNYFSGKFGANYYFSQSNFTFYGGIAIYGGILYRANQNVAQNSYNLLKINSIKKYDYGVQPLGGFMYKLNDELSFILEMNYIIGLNQLEMNTLPDQNQKLYNRSSSLILGLSFHFK